MNLFCLLAIGWELLSVGNLFCWFQMVGNLFCFEQARITGFVLGRNVFRKKKNTTYSRIFKNAATGKPKVGTYSCVFIKAATDHPITAFYTPYSCVFPQPVS